MADLWPVTLKLEIPDSEPPADWRSRNMHDSWWVRDCACVTQQGRTFWSLCALDKVNRVLRENLSSLKLTHVAHYSFSALCPVLLLLTTNIKGFFGDWKIWKKKNNNKKNLNMSKLVLVFWKVKKVSVIWICKSLEWE